MQKKVRWSFSVEVANGPKVAVSRMLMDVDTYDHIEAVIPAAAEKFKVKVQPSATSELSLVVVSSSHYADSITYQLKSADDADKLVLDQPHLFVGKGGVGILGGTVKDFYFSNDLAEDIAVQVLVARKASEG